MLPKPLPRSSLHSLDRIAASLYCSRFSATFGQFKSWTESRGPRLPAPRSSCAVCRRRASSTSSATPAARCSFIYDELFKQDKVKHVLVRHEQGAVHAADGYSRSSDKVGVALVTSGPGVTNAVTGIATAYMDSIPMVIITGQVPTHAIGLDAFQEVRHGRHHAPLREAQLPGQGRQGPGRYDQEGVLSRHDRAPRAGAGRHPQGRHHARAASSSIPRRSRCAPTTRCARAMPGRSARRRSCCSTRKRPMIYTGGGVILADAAEPS